VFTVLNSALRKPSTDTSISNVLCLFGSSKIYILNLYTPNNDEKIMYFKPWMFFVQDQPLNDNLNYSFTIFNRWGDILFETADINKGWSGEYLNALVPLGVYGYKIQVYG
jgi:gliding motility-associated-like protein